jgi:hypothetical protein
MAHELASRRMGTRLAWILAAVALSAAVAGWALASGARASGQGAVIARNRKEMVATCHQEIQHERLALPRFGWRPPQYATIVSEAGGHPLWPVLQIWHVGTASYESSGAHFYGCEMILLAGRWQVQRVIDYGRTRPPVVSSCPRSLTAMLARRLEQCAP